ncbi:hypothetical protein Rs2_21235 [Raphanus sativus]|nr:hypothetical protein Rs2_21235 [Raphanus sativus]
MYMFSTDSEAPGLLSLGRVGIKKLNLNKPPDVYNQIRAMDKDYSAPNFLSEYLCGNYDNNSSMIDHMLNRNLQQRKQSMPQQQQLSPSGFGATSTSDKMSFADVMQFADFCPMLPLNQTRSQNDQETWMDPFYILKFPVFNGDHNQAHHLMSQEGGGCEGNIGNVFLEEKDNQDKNDNNSMQIRFIGGEECRENKNDTKKEVKSKRKRARTSKTSEEVENQRMAHIAVERNRRKQMNEHLRVLRSLMPGSYVQRGDQASTIGGVIEFLSELEQLLQCLESQKRRRILGETSDMHVTESPPELAGVASRSDHVQLVTTDRNPRRSRTSLQKISLRARVKQTLRRLFAGAAAPGRRQFAAGNPPPRHHRTAAAAGDFSGKPPSLRRRRR